MKTFDIHKWQRKYLVENIEEQNDALGLIEKVKMLDTDQMEQFLMELGLYFKRSADVITNMDAHEIGKHIDQAGWLVSQRTGN